MAAFDPKALKKYEWGIVGGAAVALIGLFFHAYSVSAGPFSASVSGWHFSGLWIPVLLLLATAGLVALSALRPAVVPPALAPLVPVIPFVVGVLAVVIELIRWVSYPGASGVSAGASFGTYLIIIASVVATVFAFLNFTASGGKIQDFKNYLPKGANPPADGAV